MSGYKKKEPTSRCSNKEATNYKRTVRHTEDGMSDENSEISISNTTADMHFDKSMVMSDDLRNELKDLPDVIQYIEKLHKVIQKQIKKIIKWKMKAKQIEKKKQDAITQTDFHIDILTNDPVINGQNSVDQERNAEVEKSLTENIREAAEEAMQSSGFVYEETSGLYYDYNSGYYYNAEYGLYYDGNTGTYLKYNQETQDYEFHSQVTTYHTSDRAEKVQKQKKRNNKKRNAKESKRPRWTKSDFEDVEEGECSDSSINSSDNDDSSISESSDMCRKWPPCMRMIVESTEIPKVKPGSLFIITCDGGTIGREGNHSICLPDVNVSKHHLKVSYDQETLKYMITDLGSRNGTLLNGKRISPSKQESDPIEIPHGSKLQLGATTLLCHIHEGSQTCGHCEPGLLLENEKDTVIVNSNKKTMSQQYKNELRRLRKHHGLLGTSDETTKVAAGYTDRAQKRRDTVGSQNPYEKTQSASVEQSIPSENKGFKLLSKMGWKEGQSLGKDGTGTLEPIKVTSTIGNAGVGASKEDIKSSVSNEIKQNVWKKTQERFDKLPDKNVFSDDSDN